MGIGMGVLGAVSGGASAISDMVLMDMKEAKETRLETLRTENNRETNRINNEQRHDFSMTELKERGEIEATAASTAQGYDQENLRLEQRLEDEAPTDDMKNARAAVEAGIPEEVAYGGMGAASKDPAKVSTIKYYQELGHSKEEAVRLANQQAQPSEEQMRLELYKSYAGNPVYSRHKPEQISAMVDDTLDNVLGRTKEDTASLTGDDFLAAFKKNPTMRVTDIQADLLPVGTVFTAFDGNKYTR